VTFTIVFSYIIGSSHRVLNPPGGRKLECWSDGVIGKRQECLGKTGVMECWSIGFKKTGVMEWLEKNRSAWEKLE